MRRHAEEFEVFSVQISVFANGPASPKYFANLLRHKVDQQDDPFLVRQVPGFVLVAVVEDHHSP